MSVKMRPTIKPNKLVILSLATLIALSLTACGLGGKSSGTTKGSESQGQAKDALVKVSKEEFNSVLQNVDVIRDEFKGNYEVFGKGDITVNVGTSIISLSLSLSREDSSSDWQPVFASAYAGVDWMFHNEWNLKSNKGILNVGISSNIRDDQVQSGYVTEIATYDATQDEMNKFCEITSGTEVKFRLRGSSGNVKEVTAEMTQDGLKDAKDLCVIYSGLKQGFIIPS